MMRGYRLLAAWAIAVLIVGLGASCQNARNASETQQRRDTSKVSRAESEFVEDFLQLRFDNAVKQEIPLVIHETLSVERLRRGSGDDLEGNLIRYAQTTDTKLKEAVRDFCAKNRSEGKLRDLGLHSVKHVVLTQEQMDDLFPMNRQDGKDGWRIFYERFPKSPGLISLSRPGFSRDGTVAVIYMDHSRHWLAGRAGLHVLEKKDGVWVSRKAGLGPMVVS